MTSPSQSHLNHVRLEVDSLGKSDPVAYLLTIIGGVAMGFWFRSWAAGVFGLVAMKIMTEIMFHLGVQTMYQRVVLELLTDKVSGLPEECLLRKLGDLANSNVVGKISTEPDQ